jgi:hypothetical protein
VKGAGMSQEDGAGLPALASGNCNAAPQGIRKEWLQARLLTMIIRRSHQIYILELSDQLIVLADEEIMLITLISKAVLLTFLTRFLQNPIYW